MPDSILILGASVRAAAQSAVRAGLSPVGGDLFADADLMAVCQATASDRYPHGLAAIAAAAPPAAWMYTGGLENYPRLVDRISTRHRLLGNDGRTLRRVRDPWKLADCVRNAGLPCPDLAATTSDLPCNGSWLRKPRRSSGGMGIALWDRHSTDRPPRALCYYQQRIDGLSRAAVYVASGGQARLIGVTEQILGNDWTGGARFQYAGSIGPLTLTTESRASYLLLGNAVASLGLIGLFGVDCVQVRGRPWPVDVNPRYPASAEVLERACGVSMVGLHVAACRDGKLPEPEPGFGQRPSGKAIVYARDEHVVDAALFDRLWALRGDPCRPNIADIPRAGTVLRAGWPALTVLADGDDAPAVRDAFASRVSDVQDTLSAI